MGLFNKKKTNVDVTSTSNTNTNDKAKTPKSNKKDKKKAQNFLKFDEFFENGMMRYKNQYAKMFRFSNFSFELYHFAL